MHWSASRTHIFLLCILLSARLCGQQVVQVYYNFLNPLMMDGEGYPGQSVGVNVLWNAIGLEAEFGNTRKRHENRYQYFNPQIKLRFSKEEGTETSKYHFFSIGYMQFQADKHTSFYGRSVDLQPPYWDTLESAQTYRDYSFSVKTKSAALQVGYEKVTEKHITGVAFSHIAIVNPAGMIIGWITGEGDDYKLDFTRTFRFSIFMAPSGWLTTQNLKQEPTYGYYGYGPAPNDAVVMEPTEKNLVGARLGWTWTTVKPFGSSIGIEMTMVPGVFSRPGVYGWGFPDDNIYIKANLGIAIGYSSKND